ncbi:FixH family protein [Microvirga guangxiensis]|uniref:Nitrogen fixation protein FixH n=1 Tax=Microvirga guangxiensis TaxID=549386 RepID=A0A1G5I7F4_9HYPH|nr:FixH family protein [Microvirga guangxiensis]SCY72062.1 Nitrogen fixation protein FixH [Microvirga guangxiensis]
MSATTANRPPRVITGRTVLIYFISFFGVIFAMNFVMIRFAVSSFSGVETESSYKAGLTFKNDVAAAHAQDARHWSVEANVQRGENGKIIITARDDKAQALAGLTAQVRLGHPTDKRNDVAMEFVETSTGQFRSLTPLPEGNWNLVIDLKRGEEIVFRSKSRVAL